MSAIEWTDVTLNPVIGCSKISAGCSNCYASDTAASLATRFPNGAGQRYLAVLDDQHKRWNGRVILDRDALSKRAPRRRSEPDLLNGGQRWRPARVFLGSMTDLFHEALPDIDRRDVWRWMASHGGAAGPIFQLVTKRPDVAAETLPRDMGQWSDPRERPRIHLLTSTEDQAAADQRIPAVLRCRPWVELVGISAEPLLGPVVLMPEWLRLGHGLRWVIVGGESGRGARGCDIGWIRSMVRQCRNAAVPVFVKQLGADPWDGGQRITASRKGGNPSEWPADLRVREFPA